jgi:hypothetical protein
MEFVGSTEDALVSQSGLSTLTGGPAVSSSSKKLSKFASREAGSGGGSWGLSGFGCSADGFGFAAVEGFGVIGFEVLGVIGVDGFEVIGEEGFDEVGAIGFKLYSESRST